MKLENGIIYPLFSTPLYHVNASDYVNDVIDFDNIPYELFTNNEKQHNTMNSIEQNILALKEFETLKTYIDTAMSEYLFGQMKLSTDLDLKLVCSWMLLGFPGSTTNAHMHTNSLYSGVFYLKSEENAGDIVFSTHQAQMTYSSPSVRPLPVEYNLLNSMSWKISPKTNDIIIFPSHLLHEVTENKSGQVRCAVAFNYFITGNISDQSTRSLQLR